MRMKEKVMNDFIAEIAELKQQRDHLESENAKQAEMLNKVIEQRDELLAALECIVPYIPKSSAADGGAMRYSAAVAAADVVRAAIAKVKEQK